MPVPLHHVEYGQGEPLIILHGLLGSADNFRSIATQLGQFYHVFCLDLRNHGLSGHADTMTYADMADDVIQFIANRRLFEPILLGHSMGGKVAMAVAAAYKNQLSRLIVVDIAPKYYEDKHSFILNAMHNLNLDRYTTLKEMDYALSLQLSDPQLRGFILKALIKENDLFYWKVNLPVLLERYSDLQEAPPLFESIELPTLFIRGSESDYILDDDWDFTQSIFPNSDLVTIRGAGHWVHAESPDLFVQQVLSFLFLYIVFIYTFSYI